MANYVSSTVPTGAKFKETLGKIDNYSPDSYSWTEISSSVTVNLTNPTATTGITSPGDYVIYKFTNGPAAIPTTLSPILLSLRSSGIYVSAKDTVYSYLSSSSSWKDVNEIVEDTTILYIKSDTAPSRTSNTFWFDTSKYASEGYVDLKFYDTTSKAWISIFNDTNYLKKSTIDPNNKATDIFKYITDKVTATTGQYATFLKHKNNELTYVHVTADERNRYAKIITQSELDNLLENTYKSQIQTSVNSAINDNLDVTQITSDTNTLQTSFNSHKTGHVTAANITAWNNKADGNHTHDYTTGDVTINGSQVVAGVFTDSQLPNEMKERYYKITAASVAAEFGNTSLTDTDRAGKYHNGNAFYFESTSNGTTSRTWYRIIDQTKIGTSSWASGVTDFTAKVVDMSWGNITGKPTTFSEYGITNDLYTKTQVDNKIDTIRNSIEEANIQLEDNFSDVSYDYRYDTTRPTIESEIVTANLPTTGNLEWTYICTNEKDEYVIVGTGYAALYSANGTTWKAYDLPFYGEWISVCYGNGVFVAVAKKSPYCAYSYDGKIWKAASMPNVYWWSVCYGGGKFVAVGDALYSNSDYTGPTNIAAYSSDGITWTQFTMPTSTYWRSVCYGNGKFVAVAYNNGKVAYSSNGTSWSSADIGDTSFWTSICYGGGKFVIVGENPCDICAYSSDGTSWTVTGFPEYEYWSQIYYSNGLFVAVSRKKGSDKSTTIAYSGSGTSWNTATVSSGNWNSICSYGDSFIMVSNDEIRKVDFSISNLTWTASSLTLSGYWSDICYGNGKYVTISDRSDSDSYFAYSTDGITWTAGTMPSAASGYWYSVCYGNGKFVAVVDNGNLVSYSTDSINWTTSRLPSANYWYSVCYGNGKFVAVGYGKAAAYSTDGINWTASTMPSSAEWYSVCYGNGKFVAVAGRTTAAAYSADGIVWTASTMPSSAEWYSVCYGNGKFVAVAHGTTAAYSTDGINWTASTMPSSIFWNSVCYGNGIFVALAGSTTAAYSADGINWTATTLSAAYSIACYGDNKFVATKYGATAAYSTISSCSFTDSLINPSTPLATWDSLCSNDTTFVAICPYTNRIAYSTNSTRWTEATLPSDSSSWVSVCYGNNKFVAISKDCKIATSTDGINWTTSSTTLPSLAGPASKWLKICYGNGKFVAVAGVENTAAYSNDGITWTKSTMASNAIWNSLYYNDNLGMYVAISANGDMNYSTDGRSWSTDISWNSSTLPGNPISWISVCYGNGKFIAVNEEDSTGASSTDGINWTYNISLPSNSIYGYYSVCYGNGKFVAVNSNFGAYSTDGVNWSRSIIPNGGSQQGGNWISVCYGNGKFVTVGGGVAADNKAAYSIDGINWNSSTLSTSAVWTSICYGGGKFVAIANSDTMNYSTDGINWFESVMINYSGLANNWRSVCYGNGKFVAIEDGGRSAYSTDGINWFESAISLGYLKSVCYGNGMFVAIAYGETQGNDIGATYKAAYSTDGINWSIATLPVYNNWTAICYGNYKFITIGSYSTAIAYGIYPKLSINYNNNNDYTVSNLYYNGDKYLAIFNNQPFASLSDDCANWNTVLFDTNGCWNSSVYNQVLDKFLILAHYSKDLMSVTSSYYPLLDIDRIGLQMNTGSISDYSDMMTGVTPNIDVIIKTTDGKIYKTTQNLNSSYAQPDGTAITTSNAEEPIGASLLNFYVPLDSSGVISNADTENVVIGKNLAYIKDINTFVATTPKGPYYSKDNGNTWTAGSNCTSELISICAGNGKFVGIVNNSNIAYYSTDGITWTSASVTSTSRAWSAICYGNGKYVAIATGTTTYVAYSTNATSWTVKSFTSNLSEYVSIVYSSAISKYVAITSTPNSSSQIQVATSSDASSWTTALITSTAGYCEKILTYNNKLYIFGKTGVLISSDASSWTNNTLKWSESGSPITYYTSGDSGIYFCTRMLCEYNGYAVTIFRAPSSGYYLAKSTDCINWESIYNFGNTITPKDMLCSDSNIVIVGDAPFTALPPGGGGKEEQPKTSKRYFWI